MIFNWIIFYSFGAAAVTKLAISNKTALYTEQMTLEMKNKSLTLTEGFEINREHLFSMGNHWTCFGDYQRVHNILR